MDIHNVPPDVVARAIAVLNDKYEGNIRFDCTIHPRATRAGWRIRGVLRPNNTRKAGARVSGSGRHCAACSWEAHRDFMRHIFAAYPHARIRTMLADYRGQADFEARYLATGEHNIGNQCNPLAIREASIL